MIEHTGNACPVPSGTIVRVDLGDGEVYAGPADEWHWGPGLGYDGKGRILRYEVLQAYRPLDPVADSKPSNPKDAIGVKKAKFSVIPAGVLFDVGLAMLEGACKYGRHNYRGAGVRASVYYDAAMGHMADWWEGQNLDPDSGLSHVTKAIASLVVLRDAMFQDMLTDDRPPRSKVSKVDFNGLAAEIIDRHADKAPKHYTLKDDV